MTHIELDEDEKKDLGNEVVDMWDEDNLDRDNWLADLPKWINAYQGREERKDTPWEGASNLRVPVTPTVVDAIHPRLIAALFKPSPIVAFRPQDPSDQQLVKKRELFLDWACREEVNLFPILDRAILGTLVNGLQFLKITWELKTRSIRNKFVFPLDVPIEQAVQQVLEGEQKYIEAVQRTSDQEIKAIVKGKEVSIETEERDGKLILYAEREEVVRDAPLVTLINPEDIVVNSNAPFDLQQADHILHRYELTEDQIRREVAKGNFKYTEDELDELFLEKSTEANPDDNTYTIKQSRETITGAGQTYREGYPEKVEFIDAYIKRDINDDNYEEEVIVTVPRLKPKLVARCVRLEDVYRHGMRPFVVFSFFPVSDSIWSIGIPQVLEDIQKEFNTIHNQRIDAGEVSNQPFGWYVPAAGFAPEKIPISPGYLIPIDDITHVKMHTPSNFTAWSFQEEGLLWTLVERRTKVTDLTIGRTGQDQGAARTATGVQTLAAQQATGFDILIRRAQDGFKHLIQQILAMYQQYMPPGKEIRIIGTPTDPLSVITKGDLLGHMDMIFTANSLSSDREIERNTVTFLMQNALAPANLQFLLQMGIMNPIGIAEWYRHALTVFDVPNVDKIIVAPPPSSFRTVDEVINLLIQGQIVMPKQGEDHMGIIEAILNLSQSDAMISFPPEVKQALQQQVQLRQEAIVKEQQMALQQQMQNMAMKSMFPGAGGGGNSGSGGPPKQGGPPGRPVTQNSAGGPQRTPGMPMN